MIGTWMQSTTLPYLAYRLSGKPFDLGLIGFASTLPTLIIALPAGVLVERFDKRRTVIVMQIIMAIQALLLAALALSNRIEIWHIVVLSLVLGSASAFEITARQSMLIELVGKDALPNAIALQTAIFNGARVLGPSLTALVLVLIQNQGEGWSFLINGVSYFFIIIGLLFVKTPYKTSGFADQKHKSILIEFKEGQRYILGNTLIGLIILMAAIIGFFGFPFNQQIPALARDVLHQISDTETIIKARTSSLYIAQGIGALAASIYISAFSGIKRKGLLLAIGQVVFSLALIVVSAIKSFSITIALMVILGWSMVTQLALMNTFVQINTPDQIRGRVFSTYLWALQGVAPFGSLFIGWIAQSKSISFAAFISGTPCLFAVLIIHLIKPQIVRNSY